MEESHRGDGDGGGDGERLHHSERPFNLHLISRQQTSRRIDVKLEAI